MRRIVYLLTILSCLYSPSLKAQNQLEIARVAQMADFPTPYLMRDWKKVAVRYDSLVFQTGLTGTHFPIVTLSNESVNYPGVGTILMNSYVGGSGTAGESINIIPAIVGATLVGVDKSNHYATNWVERVKNFYNLKNGELVYLNGTSENTGNDWWYETMPNVFFYQLYTQYPNVSEFQTQFRSIADRWLSAVQHMGAATTPWTVPQMNYRAWDLVSMEPLVGGVTEPESAGAIAWILYQAYHKLGDAKYLVGAQQAMDFLNGYSGNPSYELQLPYGVLTAARMNAELGTHYDIQKMINWCFSRGELRGWGSIVGTWDGKDVSGLVGEANDGGDDYAFMMNGFQQASALVPLVKYDKRYASAVGKWVLNMANASRLFYSGYVDAGHQSDYDWSNANDTHSVIAYEAIKEKWNGLSLFARGDAKDAGWAATNLGLYGSSHVGYLGAIVQTTDVEGILQLDVNATDFYGSHKFPSYLLYNPFDTEKSVTLHVGNASIDIYDAISETFIKTAVSGDVVITIGAKSSRLLVYVPAGSTTQAKQKKLWIGADVLDHHYGYDFSGSLRIKSLNPRFDLSEVDIENAIYCTVDSETKPVFKWYVNDVSQTLDSTNFSWTPAAVGTYKIKVEVTVNTETVADSLQLEVVELIPQNPVIDSLWLQGKWALTGSTVWIHAMAHDPRGLPLTHTWESDLVEILDEKGDSIQVKLPDAPGVIGVTYQVFNTYDSTATQTLPILVKAAVSVSDPLVYLPLNGNATDKSGNSYAVTISNGSFVEDAQGTANSALRVISETDEVIVTNKTALNFKDAISVSFWVYPGDFSEERFVVSHGSWEQRWKVSITVDRKLRWTVNTDAGIRDLDSSFPLQASKWYHFVAVFTGYSMELYAEGQLDTFVSQFGNLRTSSSGIAIGKRLAGDSQYYLKGRVDEVKIFNSAIGPEQIAGLKDLRFVETPLAISTESKSLQLYPNPTHGRLFLQLTETPTSIQLIDLSGKKLQEFTVENVHDNQVELDLSHQPAGLYQIRVVYSDRVVSSKVVVY